MTRAPSALRRSTPWLALLLAGPAFLLGSLWLGFDPVAAEAAAPDIHRDGAYESSSSCTACHPDHVASWRASYHSTMTRYADANSVAGQFDGRELAFAGASTRVARAGDEFRMEVPDGSGARRVARVELAVGSHRYQQYFERVEGPDGWVRRRLPFLWHIERGQWMNVNTVFFRADGSRGHGDGAVWNANCIFCHTTAPQPRSLSPDTVRPDALGTFRSATAEFSIACEACHGPGEEHAEHMRSPLARYAGTKEPGILTPDELPAARERDVCGQCHAQRVPLDIATARTWLERGPSFRPGNVLTAHVRPIHRDTPSPVPTEPELFSRRFWSDGTPRLTAYEWQGLEDSSCARSNALRCTSCHSMHAGSRSGMMRADRRGDAACTACHDELARDARSLEAHTGHAPESAGSRCLACHMPRIVYGVLSVHRSHRIDSPDPIRDASTGRPGACVLCHLDRSPAWAARALDADADNEVVRSDGAPAELPGGVATLLAGDPLARAVVAHAATRPVGVRPEGRAPLFTALVLTLGDAYAPVRRFAADALEAWDAELSLDLPLHPEDLVDRDRDARREAIGALLAWLHEHGAAHFVSPASTPLLDPRFEVDLDVALSLLDLQSDTPVSIGE